MDHISHIILFVLIICISQCIAVAQDATLADSVTSTTSSGNDSNIETKWFFDKFTKPTIRFTKPTTTTTTTTTTTRPPTPPPTCTCGTPRASAQTMKAVRDQNSIIRRVENDNRIVGGIVSQPNAWPWMATVRSSEGLLCGGSIINSLFILTAGHCVQRIIQQGTIAAARVWVGSNSIAPGPDPSRKIYNVASIKIHPDYDMTTEPSVMKNWDVALIRLTTPIQFTATIYPICLSQTGRPFTNRNGVTAGWGDVTPGAGVGSLALREVTLKVLPQGRCQTYWGTTITDAMLCAIGNPETSGTCNGDSGGPFMIFNEDTRTFTQAGIVSFANNCQSTGVPGIFVRISRVMSFITDTTQGTSFCHNSFLP